MKLAMSAYSHAPVWMQNLLISAYGLRLRRLRYGAVGRETLSRLRQAEAKPAVERERQQLRELSEVVAAAVRDVPFHRARGLAKMTFRSREDLLELPLLGKSEVQSAGRALISDLYRSDRLTEIHTGGTTGTPLAIYCDSAALQRNYAFFTRFKERAGIHEGARIATFAGR